MEYCIVLHGDYMIKKIFQAKYFKLEEMDIKDNVHYHKYYRINKLDEALILPFVDKKNIIIEEQYRPPINKKLYELPCGHIEQGEKPEVAARRELKEETGYIAGRMRFLAKYYISPGLMTTIGYLYLATDLHKGRQSLDKDEQLSVKKMDFEKLLKLVKSNKIVDHKTMFAVAYYKLLYS